MIFMIFNIVKYMIQDKLQSQWGIWFIYQGESYEGNVHLITSIESIADVAYFWSQSPIASLSNFFLKEDRKQKTYSIEGTSRRINSIEFFRKGIQPKWEDEQNQIGGRFIFEVPKTLPNKKEVYENFTFFFLGEQFDHSNKINGFRFVSSKNPAVICYRIEIWVNFNSSDLEACQYYQKVLNELLISLKFEVKRIIFKDMRGAGTTKDIGGTSKEVKEEVKEEIKEKVNSEMKEEK